MITTCKEGHKYNSNIATECPVCKYGEPDKGKGMPIFKTKKGYKIKNVKGVSPTKKQAVKRLRAIKANKK